MKNITLFIISILFFFYGTAWADFYQWEDESGATHITDYPPPQIDPSKKIKVRKDSSNSSAADEEQEAKLKAEKKPKVTLYTKDNCPDCDKAREFLQSNKITFTEYNMDQDKAAAAKRKEIDDSEDVPYAIMNKTQIYGFSENTYKRALKPSPRVE